MNNVFILAPHERAGENAAIVKAVVWELGTLVSMIPDDTQFQEELKKLYPGGTCYAWCLWDNSTDGPAALDAMEVGDLLLCYRNRSILSAAFMLLKTGNPALTARMWGRLPEEAPEGICFTSKPHEGEVPVVPQMYRYFDEAYGGVMKLRDNNVRAILADYGSLETFVHLCLKYDFPFSLRHS